MEIRDLSNAPLNDESPDATAEPAARQALERTDQTALSQRPGPGEERTELYARLRAILDNATASIRTLKEENATLATQNTALSGQIGKLEQRIRAVTADLANDELALRRSAEVLEQVLKSPPETAPLAPATRPTPLHASQPDTEPPEPEPVDLSAETGPITIPAEADTTEPPPVPQESASTPPAGYGTHGTGTEELPALAIPAAEMDGTYTLIAYPFVRFSDLGQFQGALQKLAGVHDVQVRRFAQGTLEMRIGYTGTTDLATTLRTLVTEVEDVQEEEPSRLRVRLRTSQDA